MSLLSGKFGVSYIEAGARTYLVYGSHWTRDIALATRFDSVINAQFALDSAAAYMRDREVNACKVFEFDNA